MNSIRDWLNGGKHYLEGLALYETYGQDAILKKALRQGYSSFRQEKLVKALRALLVMADRPVTPLELDLKVKKVHVAELILPEQEVPELQDPYRDKWLPYYIEMNALRHSLISIPDDVARGQAAHRILKNERICKMWWKRRDYYVRTKEHMPEDSQEPEPITDKNLLHKNIANVRSYITKAKGRMEQAATQELRDAAQVRLIKYTKQLEELETQFKNA